jgi:hypothetical protein
MSARGGGRHVALKAHSVAQNRASQWLLRGTYFLGDAGGI